MHRSTRRTLFSDLCLPYNLGSYLLRHASCELKIIFHRWRVFGVVRHATDTYNTWVGIQHKRCLCCTHKSYTDICSGLRAAVTTATSGKRHVNTRPTGRQPPRRRPPLTKTLISPPPRLPCRAGCCTSGRLPPLPLVRDASVRGTRLSAPVVKCQCT